MVQGYSVPSQKGWFLRRDRNLQEVVNWVLWMGIDTAFSTLRIQLAQQGDGSAGASRLLNRALQR